MFNAAVENRIWIGSLGETVWNVHRVSESWNPPQEFKATSNYIFNISTNCTLYECRHIRIF